MGIDSQGIYPGPPHLVTEWGFLPQKKEKKIFTQKAIVFLADFG